MRRGGDESAVLACSCDCCRSRRIERRMRNDIVSDGDGAGCRSYGNVAGTCLAVRGEPVRSDRLALSAERRGTDRRLRGGHGLLHRLRGNLRICVGHGRPAYFIRFQRRDRRDREGLCRFDRAGPGDGPGVHGDGLVRREERDRPARNGAGGLVGRPADGSGRARSAALRKACGWMVFVVGRVSAPAQFIGAGAERCPTKGGTGGHGVPPYDGRIDDLDFVGRVTAPAQIIFGQARSAALRNAEIVSGRCGAMPYGGGGRICAGFSDAAAGWR